MPKFSKRSKTRLAQCHPDLQRLFNEVIRHVDFSVLQGHRGKRSQDTAFNNGASRLRYPRSKHNKKPSLAVDCVPYPLSWSDLESFAYLAGVVSGIASQMNIKITWGGHWKTLIDMPHYELNLK